MELEGLWWTNVLNLGLPPQRHSPDTRLEHQEPVIHMAQNKRENKRKKEKDKIKYDKAKLYRQNLTQKHKHIHSQKKGKGEKLISPAPRVPLLNLG